MFSHSMSPMAATWRMAGAAGLEPVTSAVTGQRSNQLSYAPARGKCRLEEAWRRVKFWFLPGEFRIFGQQTPRRWGWGTPLKKRAATRMIQCYVSATLCQQSSEKVIDAFMELLLGNLNTRRNVCIAPPPANESLLNQSRMVASEADRRQTGLTMQRFNDSTIHANA
jgi:hypothetical protein